MAAPEGVIRRYVEAISAADGDPAAALTADLFLATLEMTNRELETDELLYSMDVGSIFDVRDGQGLRRL